MSDLPDPDDEPNLPASAIVQAFLDHLRLTQQVTLPFTEVDPRYQGGSCHINVAHRVREAGGTVVPGWIVWQAWFDEVEHHAVWQPPGSTDLIDLTPRPDGEDKIVFLPDPSRRIDSSSRSGHDVLLRANHLRDDNGVMRNIYTGTPCGEQVDVAFDGTARALMQKLSITPAEVIEISKRQPVSE
jgi:hypothetical protein